MKKLRLTSFCLAFVMVVALMVPALSVMATAASVVSETTITLPGADATRWTGHAGYSAEVPFPATVPSGWAGKTATTSGNLFEVAGASAGSIVHDNTTYGDEFHSVTFETPVIADADLVGLLLKVKADGCTDNTNNGINVAFKAADGKIYSANNRAKDSNVAMTTEVAYLKDASIANGEWVYYLNKANGGNRETARYTKTFDGYIFVPMSYLRLVGNQAIDMTKNVGPETLYGLAGEGSTGSLTTAGLSELYVSGMWHGNGVIESVEYVYVDGYDATASYLPGYMVSAWHSGAANGTISTDPAKAVRTCVPSLMGVSQWNAPYTTSAVIAKDAAFPTGAAHGDLVASFTVTEETAPKSGVAGIIVDLKNTQSNTTNCGAVVAIDVNGTVYYSISGNANVTEAYIAPKAAPNNWTMVSNYNFPWCGWGTKNCERGIRLPGSFDGKMFIPLDSLRTGMYSDHTKINGYNGAKWDYNGATALTEEILLAAGTNVTIYGLSAWTKNGVAYSGASFVYVDSNYVNLPATLPEKENVTWTNHYGTTWTESPLTGSFLEMDDSYWGKAVSYTTFDTAKYSPATETKQTWTADANAFAGKDIADLAGIIVRVSAVNNAGGFRGFTLTTSDGKTFASGGGAGMGVSSYYNWTGSDQWMVELTNDGARVPQGESFIFVPINTFTGGISGSQSYKKDADHEEYVKGLAPYRAVTENGKSGYRDAGNNFVDAEGYLLNGTIDGPRTKYSIGYGATLLADYIREMSANGTTFASITSNVSAWSAVSVGGISLVWIDGISDVDTKPTTFPVNAETYRYDHFREFNFAAAPHGYGTAVINGHPEYYLDLINSAWHPYTRLGTVADHAANTADRALSAAFEGREIRYTSLVSNATILGDNAPIALLDKTLGTLSYNKYGAVYSGVKMGGIKITVPTMPAGAYDNTAGIMIKMDVNGVDAGGAGLGYRLVVNGVTYDTLNFKSDWSNYSVCYVQSASTGNTDWMSDGKASKNRVWGSLDCYVFIPYTNFVDANGTPLTNAAVYANGISSIDIYDGWGSKGVTIEYIDLCYADDYSTLVGAAPVLGDDIALKITASVFNPTNAKVTLTVEQEGRDEAVVLEETDGYFLYEDIKAQNMTDKLQLTLKVGDKVVATVADYSIKAYAEKALADAKTSAEAKALINAMLQYGAAAQKVAGYKVDDLATALKDFAATTVAGNLNVSGVATVKVSASLDQDINLIIKGLTGTVTATIGDRTFAVATPVAGTVVLEGILADELDETITLKVDGETVKTLSVNAYLAVVVANNTGDVVVLAKALYEYGVAAAAYAN